MQTKSIFSGLFLILALNLCALVQAAELSLAEAKQQGLVGEQYDGYLGVVSSPSPAVRALVNDINGKRRAEYNRIARANGISVSDVEALAGKKSLEKTDSGDYIKLEGQDWRRK